MYELIGQFPVNFTDYDNIHQSNVETVRTLSLTCSGLLMYMYGHLANQSSVKALKVMRLLVEVSTSSWVMTPSRSPRGQNIVQMPHQSAVLTINIL